MKRPCTRRELFGRYNDDKSGRPCSSSGSEWRRNPNMNDAYLMMYNKIHVPETYHSVYYSIKARV